MPKPRAPTPEKSEEAEQACSKYMDDVEPPELVRGGAAGVQQDAALANARCMREHGIENFPDPTFGENGEARIQIGEGSGIDPEDPDFQEAQEACEEDAARRHPSTARSAP